jgi:hypothetical protein
MKTYFLKPRGVGCKVEPNACIFLGTMHEMFFFKRMDVFA